MLNSLKLAALLAAGVTLSACGDTAAECAATGALLGAGAARVTGENVGSGALLGGAAGLGVRAANGNGRCL